MTFDIEDKGLTAAWQSYNIRAVCGQQKSKRDNGDGQEQGYYSSSPVRARWLPKCLCNFYLDERKGDRESSQEDRKDWTI